MSFVSSYGDHRDLHLLTHSFPPRRSSDLSACRRRARRMGSARSLLGGGGAQRAGLFLWPLRAAGILEAGESHGFFMATGQSFRGAEAASIPSRTDRPLGGELPPLFRPPRLLGREIGRAQV